MYEGHFVNDVFQIVFVLLFFLIILVQTAIAYVQIYTYIIVRGMARRVYSELLYRCIAIKAISLVKCVLIFHFACLISMGEMKKKYGRRKWYKQAFDFS